MKNTDWRWKGCIGEVHATNPESGTINYSYNDDGVLISIFSLGYGFGLGAADNGNVSQITNNLDGTRSQSFTYGLSFD